MNRLGRIVRFAMCAALACAALQASAQVQYRRAVRPSVTSLPDLGFSYVSFPGGAYPVSGAPHTIVLYEVARPLRPGGPPECNRPLAFALQLSVHNAGPGNFAINMKTHGVGEVVKVNVGGWSGFARLRNLGAGSSQSYNFNVTLPPGSYDLLANIDLQNEGVELRTDNNTLSWPLIVKCSAQLAAPAPIGTLNIRRP